LLFYAIIVPLFFLFSFILNKKLESINGIDILSEITPESMINASAIQVQELQALALTMTNFVYFFIIGVIVLIVVAILAFTLSRNLIWNYLLKKKFNYKTYLKFNLLNIVLPILLAILLFILLVIRMPFITAIANISVTLAIYVAALLVLIVYLAIIYFVYLVYISYVKKPKVFKSIRNAFRLIKTRFANIGISYLFILVFSIIISAAARLIWLLPAQVQTYFNLGVILLFLAWMKLYVADVYKKK
jgi:hypothetical protein